MRSRIAAVLLALSGSAPACDGLLINDPWLREAPPGTSVMAAYAELVNTGSETVIIRGVGSMDFEHGMIHDTEIRDGIARMRHRERLAIPPGGMQRLEPGGMHLMLHGPERALRAGDSTRLTLSCDSGYARFSLPVRRATP